MRRLVSAEAVATGRGMTGDSILIVDGKVAAVGMRDEMAAPGAVEKRYAGATIVPGLRDAHFHPVSYAALLDGCSLKAATDIEDLKARLVDHASSLESGEPVVATRFDDESLAERRLPTRHDLDAAIPDRPVVIYRYCGHVAVANTMALAASGVTAETSDPEGGTIDRAPGGQPTGVLRETATGLISFALARGTQLSDENLLSALRGLSGLGITSIGAMIGYGERPFEQLAPILHVGWVVEVSRCAKTPF